MNASAGKSVEVRRQGRCERFAFARLHFGDTSLMKDDAADQLNAEGAFAEHSVSRFAYRRERFGQYIVERFAFGEPLLEFIRHGAEIFVGFRLVLVRKSLDLIYDRRYFFDLFFAVSTEQLLKNTHISQLR